MNLIAGFIALFCAYIETIPWNPHRNRFCFWAFLFVAAVNFLIAICQQLGLLP